ncbi:uncharacterized protein B0J16DRAFT_345995 [Fusarium flagelliforme]|uniref:uncharacterized protein n=1 Tax=Fusarium flagelliforme TaxID=2675880 RepID=UPI001E8D8C77|nr:uncharacterized protein B0J16DRAFT_345995 [Fusarium flagelliforme]KAH7183597.1 hypothetical protein B0J16DRAFT_345995 [Fusarium flagelliforme]
MPKNRPSQKRRNEAKYAEIAKTRELEEHNRAKEVADDDTLDFATKIDRLSEIRNWFYAEGPILNKYMRGESSVAETVDILAKPIDQAYSTADFGRQYFEQERVARIQRQYHSPEKALEEWGTEEEYPEPTEEWDAKKSTEQLLWDLWYYILHEAKKIPFTDEAQHGRLVDLVQGFKDHPNPPPPVPMTIPLKRSWIWESDTIWTDLAVLGISVSEVFNDTCGCGAGWLWPEQRANENLVYFMARLTANGTANLYSKGLCCVGMLERTPSAGPRHFPKPPIVEVLSHDVTNVALWTIVAGKEVFFKYADTRDERDIQAVDRIIGLRDDDLPWNRSRRKFKGRARWETARKEFTRRRFEEESKNEELSPEVRDLAARAAEAMVPLIWLPGEGEKDE